MSAKTNYDGQVTYVPTGCKECPIEIALPGDKAPKTLYHATLPSGLEALAAVCAQVLRLCGRY